MLDRFGPLRTALAAAGAVLAAAGAVLAAAAAASTLAAAAAGASTLAAAAAGAVNPATIGGAQLAGRGVIVNSSGSIPKLPGIKASAWVVADAGTGQVLAAKDPHGWFRPASTLKVLTAISLIPALNPDATTVASKLATSVSPNIVGLLAGHAYKISDLFTALLTISANDAAVALTQATGSYAQGMAVINAEAKHLQADDTVAVTPNGLDAPGQHISAYDLALFGRQALTMPAFLKYDQTTSAQFPISKKKSVGLWNQNSLLATYPGALGGKIGWTSAAGATYVGMAKRHGRHAGRDPAPLPRADRDRRGQAAAELGLQGRRQGLAGRHAGRPAASRPPPAPGAEADRPSRRRRADQGAGGRIRPLGAGRGRVQRGGAGRGGVRLRLQPPSAPGARFGGAEATREPPRPRAGSGRGAQRRP